MLNLSKFIQPPKGYVSPEKREYRKLEKRYYAKLKRLCAKHDLTFSRDGNYWDFSQPVGTLGLNEGVENYETCFDYLKDILEGASQ
jgi:hypothetical protein|tara:strand:- start:311 stop:568 length:258 start_codon:yes stop_codon:yes gene_type:complete